MQHTVVLALVLAITGCGNMSRGQRAGIGGVVMAAGAAMLIHSQADCDPDDISEGVKCGVGEAGGEIIGVGGLVVGAFIIVAALSRDQEPAPVDPSPPSARPAPATTTAALAR